jgi:quinol monooxygenase YgiN
MGIIIAGYLDFDPDLAERLIADARPLIEAALAEPGCLAYDWSLDPLNPGRVHVFEEWASEQALAGHFAASPYEDMGAHLNRAGIRDMRVQKYRFDHAEPVYDDDGTPRPDFFTATG